MLKRTLTALVLSCVFATSAGAVNPNEGTYFFRYKTSATTSEDTAPQSKDITAYYVAGTGEAFSEKLPMKAQWEHDSWRITKGTLPAGLSFDSENLTFSGTPTNEQSVTVELTGFNANNEEVAYADAYFDVVGLPENSSVENLYGHTGFYFLKQFDVPEGVTVDYWKEFYPLPPGVSLIGRNVDGYPTKEGNYRYLIQGYNYLGEPVVAYSGTFVVEDRSSFPTIADKLHTFDPRIAPGAVLFNQVKPQKIKNTLGSPADVRYFIDVQNGMPLPGSVKISADPYNRYFNGSVNTYYNQATIRYRAKDIDDREVVSNWFKIGSLGPTPSCGVYYGQVPPSTILGTAGSPLSPYKVPVVDAAGTRNFVMASGTLPEGITFNNATGVFSGTPVKEEKQGNILVDIYVTNNGVTDKSPNPCGPFDFDIAPAGFQLSYQIDSADIRVGETVSAKLNPGGGLLQPWSVSIGDGAVLPSTVTYSGAPNYTISGPVTQVGDYSAPFTLLNGDGRQSKTTVQFTAHDQLSIADVPQVTKIRQYDTTDQLFPIQYDQAAIIGDPNFKIIGSLPGAWGAADGFKINQSSGTISGGTIVPPGTYGPFKIRLTDARNGQVDSNDFYIEVDERAQMEGTTTAPSFVVNEPQPVGKIAFDVIQPVLADPLPKTWTINKAPPSGLNFNSSNGRVYGTATTPGVFEGYQINVVDTDKGIATSDVFSITINEPGAPSGKRVASIETNTVGPMVQPVKSNKISFNESTLIGGVSAVTYVGYEPSIPGLGFNTADGTLSGTPTTEFHGDVEITFKDGAGRVGTAPLRIDAWPYPAVFMAQNAFDLPRLSDAKGVDIKAQENEGFYGAVTYSLSPLSSPLPVGISVGTDGGLIGKTSIDPDTFPNIVIRGTDKKTGITADSQSFTVNVTPQVPLELKASAARITYKLKDLTFEPVSNSGIAISPSGSYVAPLTYTISNSPAGLGINPTSGKLVGAPGSLGLWLVKVDAVDAEGTVAKTVEFEVKATLSDYVTSIAAPQSGSDVVSGVSVSVRAGQTFRTAEQTVANAVGAVTFSGLGNPATLPVVDTSTGVFQGYFANPGDYQFSLGVKDADGRGYGPSASPKFSVGVAKPLSFGLAQSAFTATQYSASNPVNIQFPAAKENMKTVVYTVSGHFPGQLYQLFYAGNVLSGQPTWVQYDTDGPTGVQISNPALLPDDALVFDTLLGNLRGIPSKAGTFDNLYVTASDLQWNEYLLNDATRDDYNIVTAGPFAISVAPEAFQIISTSNPKGVVVPDGNATATLSTKHNAYGKPVQWTAGASTLPAGITYKINGNVVNFSGYWTTTGTYSIKFDAKDALNRDASFTQTFRVLLSTDPIALNVSTITTKAGFPVEMRAPFAAAPVSTSNSFGTLVFSSVDLPSHPGIQVDKDTGALSGSLSQTQSFVLNLAVTDDTNRITSKPVTINVIPPLRIVVPTQVNVTQNAAFNLAVDTSYAIGAVSYVKQGPWPDGLNVDPASGKISGTPAAAVGLYTDLIIVGTDAAGDIQASKTFAIKVNKKATVPIMSNIADRAITEGTAMAAFTPTVANKAAGDLYTISNGTLPAGIALNPATGQLTGTASEYGIFPVTMSVRDVNGEGNDVSFRFLVSPKTPMAYDPAIVRTFSLQTGDPREITLSVSNNVGKVTYTRTGGTYTTGYEVSGDLVKIGLDGAVAGANKTLVIQAKDELGKTASITITISTVDFTLTAADVSANIKTSYSGNPFTVAGAAGSVVYEINGLPAGWSYNTSTGAINGTMADEQGAVSVSATITDQKTGVTANAQFGIFAYDPVGTKFRYWRVSVVSPNTGNKIMLGELTGFGRTGYSNAYPETTTVTALAGSFDNNNTMGTTFCVTSACDTPVTGHRFGILIDTGVNGINPTIMGTIESGSGGDTIRMFGIFDPPGNPLGMMDDIILEKSNDLQNWIRVPVRLTSRYSANQHHTMSYRLYY